MIDTNNSFILVRLLYFLKLGCEYGGYSSDITRTWPINGQFSPVQEVLYEVVLAIQTELMNAVDKIENVTLDQLFDLMCYRLGKYLQEVGVITKSLSELDSARQAAFKFCPHHVSHYLGMDIHDTPLIPRSRVLEPGMVFTIEPGMLLNKLYPFEFILTFPIFFQVCIFQWIVKKSQKSFAESEFELKMTFSLQKMVLKCSRKIVSKNHLN